MALAMAAHGHGFPRLMPQPWPVHLYLHLHLHRHVHVAHGRAFGGQSAPAPRLRALRGGQAHGRRMSFDTGDTMACTEGK